MNVAHDIANGIENAEAVPNSSDHLQRQAQSLKDNARRARLPLTDLGNAERFADRFLNKLIFVPDIGWFWYTGRHWSREGVAERIELAENETVRGIQDEAAALVASGEDREVASRKKGETQKLSEVLAHFGRQSEARQKLEAISRRAASMMSKPASALDRDPMVFNVQNGTLVFRKSETEDYVQLRPHNPADLITKISPAHYDPQAACPLYDAFLNRVQPGMDMQRFLSRWAGLSLTGYTGEQKFVFFHGPGRNGKGVWANTLKYVCGDYGDAFPIESFLDTGRPRAGGQATPDLAGLPGIRCLVPTEAEKGAKLAEGLLRILTGEDHIRARHLNKDYFTFKPQAKLLLQSNYRLRITGTDEGIWNRVLLVLWSVYIPPEDRDKNLGEKLHAEAAGILNRYLDGLRDWMDNGLLAPAAVTNATAGYRSDSDPLGRFLEDCTREKDGARIQAIELHRLFCAWARANGERAWTPKGLGSAMQERGYRRVKSNTVHWVDLELTRSVPDFDVIVANQSSSDGEDDEYASRSSQSSRDWEEEQ